MTRSRASAVVLIVVALAVGLVARRTSDDQRAAERAAAADHTIWLQTPAPQWDHAFPVGNGRLGAMVFGTVNRERIQLNEETLWMGGRRDRDNPEALKVLPDVRRLLFAGQPREAYALAERKMMGTPSRLESYQSLGDLRLTFDHEGAITDYRRELDLDAAIVRVTYRVDGVRYTREVFASHPDRVIVVRLTVDRPGALTFSTWIDRQQDARTVIAGNDRLDLIGQLSGPDGLAFLASARILKEGGTQETFPERIYVAGANAATIVVAAATSFRPGNGVRADVDRDLRAAAAQPYPELEKTHSADHRRFYRRVGLRLGPQADSSLSSAPTDERLSRVAKGATDPGLDALYFQFGRYLLIASSRPGDLPANLQGLWNDSMSPPWDADYHLNINLQMNYWPAEVTNLAELHEPLFGFIESLREPGRRTARVHYGARGFVAHHITDVWGFTSPGDLPRSGLWPTGAAWLAQHLWEHYLFKPDRAFLQRAYPTLKEAAEFFLDYLVEDPRGRLVSGPSVSPENSYRLPNGQVGILTMGPSMDHQIIAGLFTEVMRASEILDVDAPLRARVIEAQQAPATANGRQARTDSGMVGRLRRARARPPAHLAAIRAPSERSDHGTRHAGAGSGGAGDDREASGARRRPHRLEPGVDHQFLGPPRRRREGLGELSGASRQVDAAEPLGSSPAVPDRRQLRRHRWSRGDAAAESCR